MEKIIKIIYKSKNSYSVNHYLSVNTKSYNLINFIWKFIDILSFE